MGYRHAVKHAHSLKSQQGGVPLLLRGRQLHNRYGCLSPLAQTNCIAAFRV